MLDNAIGDFPEQRLGKVVTHFIDNMEFSVGKTRRRFLSGG